MGATINYDPEEVMKFCQQGAQTGIHNLITDLNKLCDELDDCQDKFHCKGGDSANAVIQIYRGFSAVIGQSSGSYSGTGLGGCAANAANVINIIYNEAATDLKAQDVSNYNII